MIFSKRFLKRHEHENNNVKIGVVKKSCGLASPKDNLIVLYEANVVCIIQRKEWYIKGYRRLTCADSKIYNNYFQGEPLQSFSFVQFCLIEFSIKVLTRQHLFIFWSFNGSVVDLYLTRYISWIEWWSSKLYNNMTFYLY